MKNLLLGLSIIFFVLTSSFAHGQNRLLRGMVTTFDSIPLINASVYIKSTKEKVLTDSIGAFKIYCNTPDKIKVSANGFIPRNVKVDESIKFVLVNLKLKSSDDAKEIAIGYGHVKDGEKLSAVEALKNKDVDFSMYKDVYDVIRGRFSGVTVEGNDIIIRGKALLSPAMQPWLLLMTCQFLLCIGQYCPIKHKKHQHFKRWFCCNLWGSWGKWRCHY